MLSVKSITYDSITGGVTTHVLLILFESKYQSKTLNCANLPIALCRSDAKTLNFNYIQPVIKLEMQTEIEVESSVI